ncbi:winged helix-turn-helix domain-containing protein [Pseudoalteromonas sp. R3]|uniref:winged helix-turn-helix domain-containing protein n=2 Tax=Pseudoalteromonas sp. R3 TaxID=1709477 RepID=UPI0009E80FBC|nr:winged helix-turn-helix domain-containing protein [Pseudoalteromonas sp. R3]AZZ97596.1 tetratricopeptide repeat protein [Pseudoalteromonas sp. R3]
MLLNILRLNLSISQVFCRKSVFQGLEPDGEILHTRDGNTDTSGVCTVNLRDGPMRYLLNNVEVDLVKGTATTRDGIQDIRAKTLAVLQILIQDSEQIVTKAQLLDTVWRGVVVQEQVLVQSVRELREILGADAIKTYPRIGYQLTLVPVPIGISSAAQKYSVAVLLSVLVLAMSWGLLSKWWGAELSSDRYPTVAFLPVDNAILDDVHAAVPLTGLTYLSEHIQKESALPVVTAEHVLTTLSHSPWYSDDTAQIRLSRRQDVLQLLERLGADLLVETRLSGFPQDMQLQYILHFKHSEEQGVVFAASPELAYQALIARLTTRYGELSQALHTQRDLDFSNEAFARGVQFYLSRNYHQAIALLRSALSHSDDPLTVRRYLAASLANHGDVSAALALLQSNIAEQGTDPVTRRERMRANLMIGYLLVNWPQADDRDQELERAQQYIATAHEQATDNADQLFIAYALEELGKIKRIQGRYSEASRLLHSALSYHQRFDAIYGQTNALIELARIATEQGEHKEAARLFEQAHQVAKASNAIPNQIWIWLAEADLLRQSQHVEQAHRLASRARVLARDADDPVLIERVEAWFARAPIYTVN